MSLRQSNQKSLDTESSAHIRMESRCSKFLLLQVWCGLLTVAMVVMVAFLSSVKPKPTEGCVSTVKPDNVTPTANTVVALQNSQRSSLSYIQLTPPPTGDWNGRSWENDLRCDSCSLVLQNNCIYCKKEGHYFIYAQVNFNTKKNHRGSNPKPLSVRLQKNPVLGKVMRILVEGILQNTTNSDRASMWVGKIIRLQETDSVSIVIEGDPLREYTFWGAYQLR